VIKQGIYSTNAGAKPAVVSHLYIKAIFLPRQARDKHRESTHKRRGIYSTNAGRGALSAAYANLEALICSGMPLLYGWLIVFFTNPKTPRWLRWGPGGHFFVAAALRFVSWRVMTSIDMSLLHIDDDDAGAGGGGRENYGSYTRGGGGYSSGARVSADGFQLPVLPSPR
jgi:hypothetical protein